MEKNNLLQFFVWMRNGTAFCTTWFLILLLACSYIFNMQSLCTTTLTKMLFLIVGGVFIFCMLFTTLFIKRWSFIVRLTCFMVLISIYECVAFFWLGLFKRENLAVQLFIFVGIILVLYLMCIFIFKIYSKKRGVIYTQALQHYQQQR